MCVCVCECKCVSALFYFMLSFGSTFSNASLRSYTDCVCGHVNVYVHVNARVSVCVCEYVCMCAYMCMCVSVYVELCCV